MAAGFGFTRLFVAAALVAALIAGCGSDANDQRVTTSTSPATTGVTPEGTTGTTATQPSGVKPPAKPASDAEAAQAVLAAVIDRDRTDPGYHSGGYKGDAALTAALQRKLAELRAKGQDFDPFLCAQNLPKRVSYARGKQAGDRMTILATFVYDAGAKVPVTYGMARVGGEWKLDSSDCLDRALA